MNTEIWKYKINKDVELMLPKGSILLSVGIQNNDIHLWVERLNEDIDLEPRTIIIFGTGWKVPVFEKEFIGTVQYTNGMVFHVFEGKNIKLEESV
jgi:hypothetical protein